MVKNEGAGDATPARPPTSLKKQTSSASSTKNGSILNFFSKAPSNGTPKSAGGTPTINSESKVLNSMAKPNIPVKKPAFRKPSAKNMTPVPSSDVIEPSSSQENENGGIPKEVDTTRWRSPLTLANEVQAANVSTIVFGSSPSRKVS